MKDVTTLVNAPAILVRLGGENVTQSCFQVQAMRIGGGKGGKRCLHQTHGDFQHIVTEDEVGESVPDTSDVLLSI